MEELNLLNLKNLLKFLAWNEILSYFREPKHKSNAGRKKEFTKPMLIKAVILKTHLKIEDDTELARRMQENPVYVDFCDMPRAPSHNILSSFQKKHQRAFEVMFENLDGTLEKMDCFVEDALCHDGAHIPLEKPQSNADPEMFGARSNKKKFYGYWMMLSTSFRTGLARKYTIGKARIGQINLTKKHLTYGQICSNPNNPFMFFDGIFDNKDIAAMTVFEQEKIPMIAYNPKNGEIKKFTELPEDDWRFDYNPLLRCEAFIKKQFKKRTAVERTNGKVKNHGLISRIGIKAKKVHRKNRDRILKNMVTISLIYEQLCFMVKYLINPISSSQSLLSYLNY